MPVAVRESLPEKGVLQLGNQPVPEPGLHIQIPVLSIRHTECKVITDWWKATPEKGSASTPSSEILPVLRPMATSGY